MERLASSMQPPLRLFLQAISDENNQAERRAVAVGLDTFAAAASMQFEVTQAHVAGGPSSFAKEQAGVATLFHLFWKLVPARLFEPGEPNYKRLVDHALERARGVGVDEQMRRALILVYKRLRQQYFERRVSTSLDLTRRDHGDLLAAQDERCAVCGYRFSQADIDLRFEEEYVLRQRHVAMSEREIVLDLIMRSPVLDHIIPLFIGGDSPANWQILCRSCNAGKGETWSALVRASTPPRRVDDVLRLTPMLRYLVLAEYVRRHGSPMDELHIVKKHDQGLVVLYNLEALSEAAILANRAC